jgi:hypothetical protein
VCQYLTADAGRPTEAPEADIFLAGAGPVFEPPPLSSQQRNIAHRPPKPKKIKHALPPSHPTVTQLIEMGFSRKRVDLAVKEVGESIWR